jgi:hypothetical protein
MGDDMRLRDMAALIVLTRAPQVELWASLPLRDSAHTRFHN